MIREHAEFVQALVGKGAGEQLGFRLQTQLAILLGKGYMANTTHKSDPYNTFICWAVQHLLWLLWKVASRSVGMGVNVCMKTWTCLQACVCLFVDTRRKLLRTCDWSKQPFQRHSE